MLTSKMLAIYLMLLLNLGMSSCITTQPIVTDGKCPPDGYFLIRKTSWINSEESCARTKSELDECLDRERK